MFPLMTEYFPTKYHAMAIKEVALECRNNNLSEYTRLSSNSNVTKFAFDFLTEVVPWGNFVLKQLAMEGFNIYLESNATWNEAFDHITTWIKQVNDMKVKHQMFHRN